MKISILALMAVVMVGGASAAWARQKADPTPDWRCTVTLPTGGGHNHERWPRPVRGRPGRRDLQGHKRALQHDAEPVVVHEHHRYPTASADSIRTVHRANQPSHRRLVPGLPEPRHVRGAGAWPRPVLRRDAVSRVSPASGVAVQSGYGTVAGDSNIAGSVFGGVPTSSVFVQPLAACSWQVTSYTSAALFANEVKALRPPAGDADHRRSSRSMRCEETFRCHSGNGHDHLEHEQLPAIGATPACGVSGSGWP